MKVITETLTKVVLEVTKEEIDELGFDFIWNEVRGKYSQKEYAIYSIDTKPNDEELIYIELIPIVLER